MKIGGYDNNNLYVEIEVDRDSLLNQLGAVLACPTGYERANEGGQYYTYDTITHEVIVVDDGGEDPESAASLDYEDGNYTVDEQLALDNARADKLFRNLRRYAVLHEGGWPITNREGWEISYNEHTHTVYTNFISKNYRTPFSLVFSDMKNCIECIKTFRDELRWYFMEYKGVRNGAEVLDD